LAIPVRRDGSARIVLLGRQGSGKGTQAAKLSMTYAIPHVSTGEAFREAIKAGTELGQRVQAYLDSGELVPDDVVLAVVRERLFGPGAPEGFILDGVPRTIGQAEALAALAEPRGIDVVVDLDVPTEEVLRRMSARRVCGNCGANFNLVDNPPRAAGVCDVCGGPLVQRDDDTEEAIRRRLELYEDATAPLIAWYRERGLLVTVDATGPPEEVNRRLVAALDGAAPR